MKKTLILLCCAFLALFSVNAQQRGGTLYHLGDFLYMMNVSPNGQYATGYDPQGRGALLWTKVDGVIYLNYGDLSNAYAVSNNGMVTGQFYDSSILDNYGNPLFTGGYFQNNQWNGLSLRPDIGVPSTDQGNMVSGISADATKIGGARFMPNYGVEPVIWTNGVATPLEFEDIGQGAKIQGLSADGTVACGWAAPDYQRHPVAWVNGQMIQIKQNNIWGAGEAQHVSPNGKYVALNINNRAAVYDVEEDILTIIGTLPGHTSASATAVSNDGIVFGYSAPSGFPPQRTGFIYSPQLGLMKLSNYLVSAGIPAAATFNFETPMATSANGLIICGFGFMNGGWVVELERHLQALNPPKNLAVTENGFRNLLLTWESPNSDPENTLTGYNIYRNSVKINSSIVTATTYSDNALPNGRYSYFIKAVWNGNEESVATNTVAMNVGEVSVPFLDNFSTANYNSNYWNISFGSDSRWGISEWNGINPPCLTYSSPGGTYQEYILSPYIDATGANELFLSFNLAPAYAWGGDPSNDSFKVEVFDGTTWQTVHEFSPSLEYPNFEYYEFDISNIAANTQIRVRLTAIGTNSPQSNLTWNLDNFNLFTPESALITSPPLNVTAHKSADGTVHVNWANPGQVATLSYIEDDYQIDIIGNEGVPFIAAAKFEPKDLIGYYGYQMKSITAYINNSSTFFSPTLKLAVFKGTTRIVDQSISYVNNSWNTFVLSTPITITADINEPLFFGIEVVYHSMFDHPIGLCFGENANGEMPFGGRADIFSEDGGQTWDMLSNWNLYGVFALKANLVQNETAQPKERLLGYKVFRDGVNLLGSDWQGNSYLTHLNNFTDLDPLPYPEVCYQVSAAYDVQQSSQEVEACVVTYLVNVSAEPVIGGTVTGGGNYEFGDLATITATPSVAYNFINWTENGTQVTSNPQYTFTVTGNRTFVANFQ
ncbi:MAG: hypothetical protein FWF70_01210, partial [Bacteroidetes bacterium]|nr:hypothetical protein [Bacteroidota bacterium]